MYGLLALAGQFFEDGSSRGISKSTKYVIGKYGGRHTETITKWLLVVKKKATKFFFLSFCGGGAGFRACLGNVLDCGAQEALGQRRGGLYKARALGGVGSAKLLGAGCGGLLEGCSAEAIRSEIAVAFQAESAGVQIFYLL